MRSFLVVALAAVLTVAATAGLASGASGRRAIPARSTIDGFTPARGGPGTVVQIRGDNLGETTGVAFHGRAASFTVDGSERVTATVPVRATTGRIRVTAPAGTVRSARPFTVVLPPSATLAPGNPLPGKRLFVKGRNFGPTEPFELLLDHNPVAEGTADATGRIRTAFMLPADLHPGSHEVELIGLLSTAVVSVAFTIFEPWPQFHFDAGKSGYQPYENVLSTSTVSGLATKWTAATGGSIVSSPAVASGSVYVGSSDGRLYAYDAATGAPRWTFLTGAQVNSSPAVGSGGIVYVGSYDGSVYAVRTSNGSLLWSYATGGLVFSSPVVANGVVYVGSEEGVLRALNASTGALIWSASCSCADEAPAVANGVVYAWRTHPGGTGIDFSDSVSAFNAATGALLWDEVPWNAEPPGTDGCCQIGTFGLTVVKGVVYVGAKAGWLCAMNAFDGSELWCRPASVNANFLVDDVPSVAKGVVTIGSQDGGIRAFNAASGSGLWSNFTGSGRHSSPAVANGVLYIGGNDGQLWALNAANGATLKTLPTGGGITSSPAVSEGRVFVGSTDGKLYAFGL